MHLRDHDRPCEHGFREGHERFTEYAGVAIPLNRDRCLGGAKVTIDDKAAGDVLVVENIAPFDYRLPSQRMALAHLIIEAGLGVDYDREGSSVVG